MSAFHFGKKVDSPRVIFIELVEDENVKKLDQISHVLIKSFLD